MSKQPNLIIIYSDQQRTDTIHALGNGHLKTPNMDRLVKEGKSFTQATTASPVCMAARWSLMTGQYSTTHRCYSNHHEGPRPDFSLPEELKKVGYTTALIGKNHSFLTPDDLDVFQSPAPIANPDARAAKENWFTSKHPHYNPRLLDQACPGGPEADEDHNKTEAALRFLNEQSTQSSPFFLWLSYIHPHTPYYAPAPWYDLYMDLDPLGSPKIEEEAQWLEKPFRHQFHRANNDATLPFTDEQVMHMRRVYAAQVSYLDHQIGRVLDALDKHGMTDNTLLLFMSDHGDYMGDHGLITKSPSLYDCLVRTPFIARGPGVVANTRSEALVEQVDVMPTFLSAAHAEIPEQVQGKDLTGLFNGSEDQVREVAFAEYGIPGEAYDETRLKQEGIKAGDFFRRPDTPVPWEGNPVSLAGRIRMARNAHWKLVEEIGGTNELYDLVNDPHELVNLYGQPKHLEIQNSLHGKLDEWKSDLPGIELDRSA